VAVAGPLALLTGASWLGTVLASSLVASHPLVLVALSPRLPFLAVAAAEAGGPAFFVVGAVRLALADPSHFLLGRMAAGEMASRWPGARRARALVRRLGPAVVLARPNGPVLLAAGAAGMRPRTVALADLAGTAAHLTLVWAAARTVEPLARAAAAAVPLVAGGVALVAIVAALATRCAARRVPSVPAVVEA
jgi:hypothetical protein